MADGDGLAHRGQLHGHRALSDQGGFAHQAVPGYNVQIQDLDGKTLPNGQKAPSSSVSPAARLPPTLWKDDKRYLNT